MLMISLLRQSAGRVRTLKIIKCSYNFLNLFPETLGEDQLLTRIEATNNRLESLLQPSDLRRLRKVEVLLLANNQIGSVNRTFDTAFDNIYEVDLTSNQVTGFLIQDAALAANRREPDPPSVRRPPQLHVHQDRRRRAHPQPRRP